MEIPEGFANARFIFNCAGVLDPMSFGIGCQGDVGMSAQDIADALYTQYRATFCPNAGTFLDDWTFVGVSVTHTVGGTPIIGEHLAPIQGSSTANGQSVNTAVLVRKNTASGGRKNRGRMFVPPFDLEEEVVATSGHILASEVSDYQVNWDAWHGNVLGDGIGLWLLHSNPADAPTPITSFTVQSLCATQRRRMR